LVFSGKPTKDKAAVKRPKEVSFEKDKALDTDDKMEDEEEAKRDGSDVCMDSEAEGKSDVWRGQNGGLLLIGLRISGTFSTINKYAESSGDDEIEEIERPPNFPAAPELAESKEATVVDGPSGSGVNLTDTNRVPSRKLPRVTVRESFVTDDVFLVYLDTLRAMRDEIQLRQDGLYRLKSVLERDRSAIERALWAHDEHRRMVPEEDSASSK
jgi:hypothetical protein